MGDGKSILPRPIIKKTTLISWKIPGTKRIDHNRAVKMYERAAGDKTLPSDLRPPQVLKVNSFLGTSPYC